MWYDMRNGWLIFFNFYFIYIKVNLINNKFVVVQDVKFFVKYIIGYIKVNFIIKFFKYG